MLSSFCFIRYEIKFGGTNNIEPEFMQISVLNFAFSLAVIAEQIRVKIQWHDELEVFFYWQFFLKLIPIFMSMKIIFFMFFCLFRWVWRLEKVLRITVNWVKNIKTLIGYTLSTNKIKLSYNFFKNSSTFWSFWDLVFNFVLKTFQLPIVLSHYFCTAIPHFSIHKSPFSLFQKTDEY